MGTAVRRIPPDTQGLAVALLASRPWTKRPGARSAHHPGTGLFSKGILGGGPNYSGMLPLLEPDWPIPRCPAEAGQSVPHGPSAVLQPGLLGACRRPSGPRRRTCVITRVPHRARTHRPQLQWQTRSSPRRCGRM